MAAKVPKIAPLLKSSLIGTMQKRLDALQRAGLHTLYGFDPYDPKVFKTMNSQQGLTPLKEPVMINPQVLECLAWMLNIMSYDLKKIIADENEELAVSLKRVSPIYQWISLVNDAHHVYIKSSQAIYNTLVPNPKYVDYIKHQGRSDTINAIILDQGSNLVRIQFEIFLYLLATKFGFIAQFNNVNNLKNIPCPIKAKNLLSAICDMNEYAGGNLAWIHGIVEIFKGNLKSSNIEIMEYMARMTLGANPK
jgi:hypothetical protein